LGRPPAIEKETAIITSFPIVNLTATSTAATSRKNYDTGEDEVKMDKAVLTVIQARGHHIKRTAQIYGVSGTSLLMRYTASIEDIPDSAAQITGSRKRGSKCILPTEVDNLALFCRYMASCNLAIDRTQLHISSRSAINLIYKIIDFEFMPIMRHGIALVMNSISISTASFIMYINVFAATRFSSLPYSITACSYKRIYACALAAKR
jgi:hypothetical protein